ncbi:asparagine synthase (glutamine-hydrolyzing) [Kordiimonas sp. SCSIO 12603]|uniref:asparagine synthase (glutamine-hydrolyzing) n=1 Tax=Kordiimonas sp. SCSIO 12603 TaxID=2829596 RepID=UPI002106BBE1|nr:asparagine synthase (glutamine-hydrolyzing) [Kordiimonas sp. SCSIO 12603]UTW58952.1 asparagine synthase (glutamine-hydrolyzing) [Kordiimonas sp. SCSIO 12603]
MCGLLFVQAKENQNLDNNQLLETLKLMSHRGPNHMGSLHADNTTFLGHTRLSILDTDKRSNQPFFSRCGRYCIIYNGEIYNYMELKRRYRIKTKTSSDTEVLLELYIKLGPKVLYELNGMFAFVIYDIENREIFAARDRLGIKPLYYYQHDDTLIFSSEISSVCNLLKTQSIDQIGLRQYLKLRTFFNNRTLYNDIKMFPAGSFFSKGRVYKYWDYLDCESHTTDACDEEVQHLIESSVNYRCIADVPLGSFLSGGVDSSIIASLSNKPDTWTVGFKDNNEFKWAKIIADKLESKHTEVTLAEEEFLELTSKMIRLRQEPLSVPNEVLLYKMSAIAKAKNTVILSGEGADELFYGYDRIFRWAHANTWNIKMFDELYSYGSHRDDEVLYDVLQPYSLLSNSLEKVSAFFQVSHLHGLLRRLDNSSMLGSIEARVPFVDHRLVEYMKGRNFEYRIQHNNVKAPLKRIFSHFLTPEIINRPKIGFAVPLQKIFNSNKNPMDNWLDFNMSTLLGDDWPMLKREIFAGIES